MTRLRGCTLHEVLILDAFWCFFLFSPLETRIRKNHHIASSDDCHREANIADLEESNGVVRIPARVIFCFINSDDVYGTADLRAAASQNRHNTEWD